MCAQNQADVQLTEERANKRLSIDNFEKREQRTAKVGITTSQHSLANLDVSLICVNPNFKNNTLFHRVLLLLPRPHAQFIQNAGRFGSGLL